MLYATRGVLDKMVNDIKKFTIIIGYICHIFILGLLINNLCKCLDNIVFLSIYCVLLLLSLVLFVINTIDLFKPISSVKKGFSKFNKIINIISRTFILGISAYEIYQGDHSLLTVFMTSLSLVFLVLQIAMLITEHIVTGYVLLMKAAFDEDMKQFKPAIDFVDKFQHHKREAVLGAINSIFERNNDNSDDYDDTSDDKYTKKAKDIKNDFKERERIKQEAKEKEMRENREEGISNELNRLKKNITNFFKR